MSQTDTIPRLRTAQTALAADGSRSPSVPTMVRRRLWIGERETIEVPCAIEIERSAETLHAHVSLDGIEVDCGDEVLIHAAPSRIAFGDRITTTSRATVIRATPFRRWLTRMQSYLALTELYEVGFQPRHEICFTPAQPEPAAASPQPAVSSTAREME